MGVNPSGERRDEMGVIIQYDGIVPLDDLERMEDQILKSLERNGIVVLDGHWKVVKIDDKEETQN